MFGPRPRSLLATAASVGGLLFPVVTSSAATATVSDSGAGLAASALVRASNAAPPPPTLFGTTAPRRSGETLGDAVTREENTFGGLHSVRLFYTGLPDSWSKITPAVGSVPLVVSFKANPKAVLAGTYDKYLRTWFAQAPTTRRTWWSYFHEPEDNIAAGQFSLRDYRAAWTHIVALSDAAHMPRRLRPTLILMCYTLSPQSGRNWHDYYVAGAPKVLGFDCYNKARDKGYYRDPAALLGAAAQAAASVGRPWGVAELGSTLVAGDQGTGRAAWLQSVANYAANHGARFVTYFDSTVGADFRLLDRPSQQAWGSWTRTR